MAVTPSGDGAAWVTNIDVDQPHGLDYRAWNHLALAVQNRLKQEHALFADATVGGIHKPGGTAVLGIDDDTANFTGRDGTYRGHGIVWDGSINLWCWTAVGGATAAPGVAGTADMTILKMHPDKQWGGGDVTWAGAHEFASTARFKGTADFSG